MLLARLVLVVQVPAQLVEAAATPRLGLLRLSVVVVVQAVRVTVAPALLVSRVSSARVALLTVEMLRDLALAVV
jgi:hypothetical protein